ncbi:MAG TPA: flagellin [Solirubrobacteraceae bacterium]|jgi:flagellar hook-associated protein 3 FlgL|nr:flagellin [Solirubrobacteraceae bacterium]
MTERITSAMVGNTTIANIESDLTQLSNTQEQLSTGFQINQPSDNPYGAALAISLNGQVSAYSAYQSNVSQGTAWVESASTSLQSIAQTTQSIRSLVVEGANGTMSSTDLNDIGQEVLQYMAQIKQSANAEYDGSFIFSGDDVSTEPWSPTATAADPAGEDSFNGNTNSINYSIGPSTQSQVNFNLYGVLGDGQGSGGAFVANATPGQPGTGGLLSTLRTIYNDMTGTNGGTQADLENQLTNLDTNISSLEGVQASVGATQDSLQMASTRLTALSTSAQTDAGNVQDTDMAKATVTFSTEQAGYQAALQSAADIIQTSLLNFLQG